MTHLPNNLMCGVDGVKLRFPKAVHFELMIGGLNRDLEADTARTVEEEGGAKRQTEMFESKVS